MDRNRRKAETDRAYDIQVRAGLRGAAQFSAIGLGVTALGHRYWPAFRKQTLPFKGFLVSIFTIFGLVIHAENALQSHELQERVRENAIRKEARIALARRGLVPTETEIAKWRAEREEELRVAREEAERRGRPDAISETR